jgi:hypothetical protein
MKDYRGNFILMKGLSMTTPGKDFPPLYRMIIKYMGTVLMQHTISHIECLSLSTDTKTKIQLQKIIRRIETNRGYNFKFLTNRFNQAMVST